MWTALEVAGPLIQQARAVARLFSDPWFAEGVGQAMTCAEAGTIERWLRVTAPAEVGDTWLAGHALGDDDPDDEHRLDQFDHIPQSQWPSWVHHVVAGDPAPGSGQARTCASRHARTAAPPTPPVPTPKPVAARRPTRGRWSAR